MAIDSNFIVKNGLKVEGSAHITSNVGIGQTSPQVSLHIGNTSPTIRLEDSDGNTVIDFSQSNTDLSISFDTVDIIIANDTSLKVNTTIIVDNGNVSSPSITFSGDTDTGIYHIGSDNLGVSVGGILAQEFTESGNIVTTEFPNGPTVGRPEIVTEKTTGFTFSSSDANRIVPVNLSSANSATIANSSTLSLPIGSYFAIVQTGSGQVTWANAAGVTFNVEGDFSLSSKGQHAVTFAIQLETDVWTIAGNLELV